MTLMRRNFILLLAVALLSTFTIPQAEAKKGMSNAKVGKSGGGIKGKKGGKGGKKGGKPDIVTLTASGVLESKTYDSLYLATKNAPAADAKKGKPKSKATILKIDFHTKTTVTLDGAPSNRGKVLPGMHLTVTYAMQKSTGKKIAASIEAHTKAPKAKKAKPAAKKNDSKKPAPKPKAGKKPAPKKK